MSRTMTMGESKYGAPVGLYTARFLGIEDKDHPEFGAGLEWRFEIIDGPQKGHIISRTTGCQPSLRSGCGKMLQAIVGAPVQEGTAVDLAQYVGRTYQVMVEVNSTGNGTRVGSVAAPGQPQPQPTPSAPPGGQPAAPPMKVGPPPAKAPTKPPDRFLIWDEEKGEPREVTRAEVQQLVQDAASAENVPLMSADKTSGFDFIPF
jgi:hypothetical protein